VAWIRRRQERKAAIRAARLLLALESLSTGPRRNHRATTRASLGASR
jgi:hypothetical protein